MERKLIMDIYFAVIMRPLGHAGIMLIVYAPIAYVLLVSGKEKAMGTGLIVAVLLTLSPDIDMWLPFVAHRGITHSLVAAVCLGVGVGVAGWMSSLWSPGDGGERAALGFLVGSLSILSHLLGDVITPMGVKPFLPLNQTSYTADLVSAFSPEANRGLFILGVVVLWMALNHGMIRIAAREAAADESSARSTDRQPREAEHDRERPVHPSVRTGAPNGDQIDTDVPGLDPAD